MRPFGGRRGGQVGVGAPLPCMNEQTPEPNAQRKFHFDIRSASRVGALASSMLLLALGLLPVLPFAVYFWGLRCDEMCAGNTYTDRGWRGDPGAWQWDMQILLAVAAVGAAAVAVRHAWRGDWRRSWRAIAIAALGYAGWIALLA